MAGQQTERQRDRERERHAVIMKDSVATAADCEIAQHITAGSH